jgi:di/tricarboxylate transporter
MPLVNDRPEQLREFETPIAAPLWSGDHQVDEAHPLSAENQQIAEVVVMAGSRLQNVRLRDARLSSKYKLTLLAVHRAGKVSRVRQAGSLQDTVLDAGDVLLVQGTQEDVAKVKDSGELLVLDGGADLPRTRKAPLALAIMVGVVSIAAVGVLPISISAVAGVMALIATRCIQWRDLTRALSVQVILIIVASLALGSAMMRTGAADFVAQVFVGSTFGLPSGFVIAALILMIGLLTNVVSNNAAAVIGTPIAISIAQRLGLPLEPFVLAVLFGANMSFATPMAYQTNLLVMNAGGYKFGDFVRVGVPLALIMWIVYSILLTWAYQL